MINKEEVLADLEKLHDEIEAMTDDSVDAVIHGRFLLLANKYKPELKEDLSMDAELLKLPLIEAVKRCRALTGLSLMESKYYVENLHASKIFTSQLNLNQKV